VWRFAYEENFVAAETITVPAAQTRLRVAWLRSWAFFALDDKSLRDERQAAAAQQSVVGASRRSFVGGLALLRLANMP
jgi:hypothetical protein